MLKKLAFPVIVSASLLLVACNDSSITEGSAEADHKISISGSTSVGPLAEKLAEQFKETSDVTIEINQVGSSAGITNVISDVSEIGMSSRELTEEETADLEEVTIAYDGIVVITNTKNDISNLTLDQVKQIFKGEITNWSELGGDDSEIVVVSREDGSGTRDAFQEIVGYESDQLIGNALVANGNGNIKTTVATNTQAIGYISFEYIDDTINPLSINDVEPAADNVLSDQYPISRPFLFVYKENSLSDNGQEFIDYILSEEGQEIVSESGAIPLNK